MTVAELIEALSKIEDKSLPVAIHNDEMVLHEPVESIDVVVTQYELYFDYNTTIVRLT